MNQFGNNEQFTCSFGCENANQCEYYNNMPHQVLPQLQNYVENNASNLNYGNHYEDCVVPSNQFENSNSQHMQSYPNYSNHVEMPPQNAYYEPSFSQNGAFTDGNYFTDNMQTYPPCQGPQPWNFAQCYGYYGEAPCQFSNVVDMEDFM